MVTATRIDTGGPPPADGVYREHPALGRAVDELTTPVALVDLDILERNIATMAAFFAGRPAHLRPHAKTHRAPAIARMQIDAGAHGITVPKTSVGEVMADGGVDDIFVANQVVAPGTIRRLAELGRRAKVTVLADQLRNARDLSDAATAAGTSFDVLVEIDGGMGRCGTQPGQPTLDLVREITRLPGLRFGGVHVYEGHVVQNADRADRVEKTEHMLGLAMDTVDLIRREGYDVETVTCGGTGTYDISGVYPGVTEHQSGSYVYMDPGYAGKVPAFGLAFSILATVVSRPMPDKAIIDAGTQVFSPDKAMPEVKDIPNLDVRSLSEEHGKILTSDGSATDLEVGQKIEVYPSHCCTAANLHDSVYGVRNGTVETVWAVSGRGKSQ